MTDKIMKTYRHVKYDCGHTRRFERTAVEIIQRIKSLCKKCADKKYLHEQMEAADEYIRTIEYTTCSHIVKERARKTQPNLKRDKLCPTCRQLDNIFGNTIYEDYD